MADWLDIAKTGIAALSAYGSYKDQKRKNELQQQAYSDYVQQVADATKAAEAAIAANLTPMVVSGAPTTKADVTDYTAATGLRHGGISNLRKGYASRGFVEDDDIEIMDEEVITPYDLKMEEGVNIGEQVFYNTGKGDRANALMIWDQMSTPDKSIYDFDFEIFFQDGGWREMIKGEAPMPQGETQMASHAGNDAWLENRYQELLELGLSPAEAAKKAQEELSSGDVPGPMATGGVAGLRHGGRPGYAIRGFVEELDVDTEGNPRNPQDDPAHQAYREIYSEFMEKFPGIATGEETIEEMIAMLQAEEVIKEDVGILGLNSAMDMITPQSAEKSAQKISMGDTQYGDIPYAQGGRIGYRLGTPDTTDVEIMDEEFVGDNELKMEEGVKIGPMAKSLGREVANFMRSGEFSREEMEDIIIDFKADGGYSNWDSLHNFIESTIWGLAKGGRAGYRYGDQVGITAIPRPVMDPRGLRSLPAMATKDGMMDLGGLEKDYRFDGGFVPIGAYEKKDDVPARLSKNEFVFTADAVRAAGGGSINKGAKRMYDTMKHLEAQPTAKRMTA